MTDEFTLESYRELYGAAALALMIISENGRLSILTSDSEYEPQSGESIISVVISSD